MITIVQYQNFCQIVITVIIMPDKHILENEMVRQEFWLIGGILEEKYAPLHSS